MDKSREVTTIVEDHVEGLVTRERCQGLLDAPVVLLLSLALPCEDWDSSRSDAVSYVSLDYGTPRSTEQHLRRRRMILRREDVLTWSQMGSGMVGTRDYNLRKTTK